MARVKLSAMFTSMSGRFGGGVFRAWKGITSLASLPESVRNPNSAKQSAVREILGYASKLWAALPSATRTAWESVAETLSEQWDNAENEVGSHRVIRTPRGPFTALGALTSVATLLHSVGQFATGDAAPDPPVGEAAPTPPTGVALSGDTDGLVVDWTDPTFWGQLAESGEIRVWLRSDDGVFFAQLIDAVAEATETYTITEAVPRGGDEPVALTAGYYYVQLDAVNRSGFRSMPSAVAEILLEEPSPP
jgi:hypothetical protein